VLFAERGGREAALDHRHQRLAILLLEGELGLEREGRAVAPGLGRVEEQAMRPVDDPKAVLVSVELVARGPERHGPHPADAKVARGLNDPAEVIRPVEGLLAALPGERVEDRGEGGVDLAREAHVRAHRPASRCST
jgi:hypothetical protein